MNSEQQYVMADIGDIGFGPGADDVLTPESGTPNVFKQKDPMDTFSVDTIAKETTEQAEVTTKLPDELQEKKPVVMKDAENILSQEIDKFELPAEQETEEVVTEKESKGGRPKIEKSSLADVLLEKYNSKEFDVVYDDMAEDETVEQYINRLPVKDQQALLDANINKIKEDSRAQDINQALALLPPEFQYAAQYYAEGGTDLKTIFRALAQAEEVKQLNPEDEADSVQIARTYLQATGFGRGKTEVIEKQINEWREAGKIEEKAAEFKPDLDEMQKEQVEFQLRQQQEYNQRQQEAANAYIHNVKEALKPGELAGIKVDKKILSNIEYGLTNLNWPSISGQPTNLLGHLLDKIQYAEPNYQLLAKATWLLMDPEGYDNAVRQQGKNEQVEKVTKILNDGKFSKGGNSLAIAAEQPVLRKAVKPRNVLIKN